MTRKVLSVLSILLVIGLVAGLAIHHQKKEKNTKKEAAELILLAVLEQDSTRSIELLEEALVLEPENAHIHKGLAHVYNRRMEFDKANLEFARVVELDRKLGIEIAREKHEKGIERFNSGEYMGAAGQLSTAEFIYNELMKLKNDSEIESYLEEVKEYIQKSQNNVLGTINLS